MSKKKIPKAVAKQKTSRNKKATKNEEVLRLPAIQIRQGTTRFLYSFAVDGKELPKFTTVSRIRRGDESEVLGYQRPEVISHISEIREYIESENPMIPNALVIAFDKRVKFKPSSRTKSEGISTLGHLEIPIDESEDEVSRPGWIVDGQQRAAAIREARVDSFPISATAFIAANDREQREQFILVNSTKPLPKGLIYELLPTTDARLPSLLQRRRFPAEILNRLNRDVDSPLHGLIKTPTTPEGKIKDGSILKMLENSLSDGVLYRFRDPSDGRGDIEAMLDVLKSFWLAVRELFDNAWGQPPRRSRLMHGAGIVSLGFVMDAIADRYRNEIQGTPSQEQFNDDLEPLVELCRWTDGYWDFGPGEQRKWNDLQNLNKDVQLLANYLLRNYKALVWNRVDEQVGAEV